MTWRKLNNILHRDLGYFFVGMTLIYAISGIAINHIDDWNPNYSINNKEFTVNEAVPQDISKEGALKILERFGESDNYKSHYYPDPQYLKIFVEGGSVLINRISGEGTFETIRKRPLLYEMNFLHYNPGVAWKYFSDIYAVGLIILAITGLFVLRGKKGLKGRGKWFVGFGIIIPILFLFYY